MKPWKISIFSSMSIDLRSMGKFFFVSLIIFMYLNPVEIWASNLPTPSRINTNVNDIESFADDFFTTNMARYNIPGAVFVVVKDGAVVLQKGYGYSNLEHHTIAHPSESLFRIASVTKLFSAIAILQLVEKGDIHLTDDVNQYLSDFKVSNPFTSTLTIKDLLTHTDGFEERNTRIFALNPSELIPLGELLASELKPLVNPPGSMITYGSFSTALASYIVQMKSGLRFEQYVRDYILTPLGMHHSTLEQVLSPDEMQRLATTYTYSSKGFEASPYLYLSTPATGGASVTGADMGNLLIALLQRGVLNEKRVLSEDSVSQMFSRQFSAHPDLPGVTLGFFEHFENNQSALIREGSGLGVNSRIFVLEHEKLAFFVAYNTRGSEMNEALTSAFLDRYYPDFENMSEPSTAFGTNANITSGFYSYVHSSQYTLTKISKLLAGLLEVRANDDGSLSIKPALMGDPYGGFEQSSRWIEIKPMVYEREDGFGRVYFEISDDGKKAYLYSGQGYHGSYQRMQWFQTPFFHLLIIVFFGLSFIASILFSLKSIINHKLAIWTNSIRIVIASINIIFIIASLPIMFSVGTIAGFPSIAFVGHLNPFVLLTLALPICSTFLLVSLLFLTLRSYLSTKQLNKWGLYFLAVGVLFSTYLGYWNLLGFNL